MSCGCLSALTPCNVVALVVRLVALSECDLTVRCRDCWELQRPPGEYDGLKPGFVVGALKGVPLAGRVI